MFRFENRLGVAERMKTDPKYTAKDIQRVLDAEKRFGSCLI